MRLAIRLSTAALMGLFGMAPALAQSPGLVEAVGPNGAVTLKHALTPEQKSAIYNAASRQKIRPPADRIAAAVGAPVPASVNLIDLPGQAAVLKYAFVENQVVVVDPIAMRVVDIIHGGVRP